MIFLVQAFLEDVFERRRYSDSDRFAVKIANIYEPTLSVGKLSAKIHRIRTTFFAGNRSLNRASFEAKLASELLRKFPAKKKEGNVSSEFEGGLWAERKKLQSSPKRSIAQVLGQFQKSVEARAIDVFWESRKRAKLRSRAEKLGQGLLGVFLKAVVASRGLSQREVGCGTGFVDNVISFGTTPHLIEMKVWKKGAFEGVSQLGRYMTLEERKQGWLVVFDARSDPKTPPPRRISISSGAVNTIYIDINPTAPSRRK